MFSNIYFIGHIAAVTFSYTVFFVTFLASGLYLIQDYNLKTKHLGKVFDGLPDLSTLDKIIYRSIGLGFPILTIAVASGLFLQKDVTGSYWGAAGREIYSLVLWLLYAVILHVRLLSKIRGKKVAVLSIFAFAIIVASLFAACGGTR